jgi:hypothetical protein
MKTPTRILVGGPEVTSAFVLMGLALARRGSRGGRGARNVHVSCRVQSRCEHEDDVIKYT